MRGCGHTEGCWGHTLHQTRWGLLPPAVTQSSFSKRLDTGFAGEDLGGDAPASGRGRTSCAPDAAPRPTSPCLPDPARSSPPAPTLAPSAPTSQSSAPRGRTRRSVTSPHGCQSAPDSGTPPPRTSRRPRPRARLPRPPSGPALAASPTPQPEHARCREAPLPAPGGEGSPCERLIRCSSARGSLRLGDLKGLRSTRSGAVLGARLLRRGEAWG